MQPPHIPNIVIHNAKRLKETYTILDDGTRGDGFLMRELRTYNLHNIFYPIYQNDKDNLELAVFKSAFIILAYTYNSTWIDINKDRYLNKMEIISSLVSSSGIDINAEMVDILVTNKDMVMVDVFNIYVHWQKSAEFQELLALEEHRSFCNKMAMSSDVATTTDVMLKNRTDYLARLEDVNRRINKIREEMKTKYMLLDEVLTREGKKPISENIDLTVYEQRLMFIVENKMYGH